MYKFKVTKLQENWDTNAIEAGQLNDDQREYTFENEEMTLKQVLKEILDNGFCENNIGIDSLSLRTIEPENTREYIENYIHTYYYLFIEGNARNLERLNTIINSIYQNQRQGKYVRIFTWY